MPDVDLQQRVARLEAQLSSQAAALAAQRAELAARRQHDQRTRVVVRPSRPLRVRLAAALSVALLVALVPMSLFAANPFNDLNPGSVHNANIDAIFEAGITKGCDPGVAFCPNANVTREEMASFLARTAGLGDNPPVANAKTAQTATSAATAGNANTVGGLAPSELVRVARAVGVNQIDNTPANPFEVTGTFDFSQPATATYNELVTVALTAPSAGFVLVNGAVTFLVSNGNTVGVARLRDPITGQASPPEFSSGTVVGSRGTVGLTYVFPVQAGERIFTLQVSRSEGAVSTSALDGVLTALFVPFGSTGGTTLEAR